MQAARDAMTAAQASANEEGKSSAGDKYETARAMGQLDRDMFARQYEQARQEMQVLDRLDQAQTFTTGALGALVKTSVGPFWLAVSAGPVTVEGQTVMVVSPRSPAGAALLGKRAGDRVTLAGRMAEVETVE